MMAAALVAAAQSGKQERLIAGIYWGLDSDRGDIDCAFMLQAMASLRYMGAHASLFT